MLIRLVILLRSSEVKVTKVKVAKVNVKLDQNKPKPDERCMVPIVYVHTVGNVYTYCGEGSRLRNI